MKIVVVIVYIMVVHFVPEQPNIYHNIEFAQLDEELAEELGSWYETNT